MGVKLTGILETDLAIIKNFSIIKIKNLLRKYDKYKYSLVLADYPFRDQDYKNKLFFWIMWVNKIPTEILAETVKYLTINGAYIDYEDQDGHTAIILALKFGYPEVVRILLVSGANVNHQNNEGETILIEASKTNNLEIVKILLAKGADINHQNNNGNTSLILASRHNQPDIVKLLLVGGADVNHKNIHGETAFAWALSPQCLKVLKILLENGADLNLNYNYLHGYNSVLIRTSINNQPEIVKMILEYGVFTDQIVNTSLIQASKNGHSAVVKILLDSQEPEYFMVDGLPECVQNDIIERLKKKAIKLNEDPITLASKAANLELFNLLHKYIIG